MKILARRKYRNWHGGLFHFWFCFLGVLIGFDFMSDVLRLEARKSDLLFWFWMQAWKFDLFSRGGEGE